MTVIATISTDDPDVFEAVWNAVRAAGIEFRVQFQPAGVDLVSAPAIVYQMGGVIASDAVVEALARLSVDDVADLPPKHDTDTPPTDAPVSCQHCGRSFDKPHGLTVHLRRSQCGQITRAPFDQDKARARAAEAI